MKRSIIVLIAAIAISAWAMRTRIKHPEMSEYQVFMQMFTP